jgi:SAM-dependent methyltransferase
MRISPFGFHSQNMYRKGYMPPLRFSAAEPWEPVKAAASDQFDDLPLEFEETSMPEYQIWRKFMTPEVVDEAFRLLGLLYIYGLRQSEHPITYDIVDIGTGYGDYLFQAEDILQRLELPDGEIRLVGIDIMDTMIRWIQARIAERKTYANEQSTPSELKNVSTPKSAYYEIYNRDIFEDGGSRLPANSTGAVVLSSMFHLSEARKSQMLAEADRLLVPGGRVLLTHWYRGYEPRGPEDHLRPRPQDIVKWIFDPQFQEEFEFIGFQRLAHQGQPNDGLYGLVLEKKAALQDAQDSWGQALFRRQQLIKLYPENSFIQSERSAVEQELLLYHRYHSLARIQTAEEARIFVEALVMNTIESEPESIQRLERISNIHRRQQSTSPFTATVNYLIGHQAPEMPDSIHMVVTQAVLTEMVLAMVFMARNDDQNTLKNILELYPQIHDVIQNPPENLSPLFQALQEYLEEQELWQQPFCVRMGTTINTFLGFLVPAH